MNFTDVSIAVSVILSLFYVLFVFEMLKAWRNIKCYSGWNEDRPFISVIVCMRNESKSITDTLKSLAGQDYPNEQFEIIVSDDFSEDDSVMQVQTFTSGNRSCPIRILKALSDQKPGKKFALAAAVKAAKGEIIALTDADCTMNKEWLKTLVTHHYSAKAELTGGPVRLTGNSFFQQMQKIEFMSLSGITGSAIQLKNPLMINAANMMFNRKIFIESGRLNPTESSASGDDTFFMLRVTEKKPTGISFCKEENAMVETPALSGLVEFIQQRIRWAAKTKFYSTLYIRQAGIGLFLFHFLILLFFILTVIDSGFLIPAFILMLSKWMADGIILFQYYRFYKVNSGMPAWIFTFLLHPVYMTLIPLLTIKRKYEWKGRISYA